MNQFGRDEGEIAAQQGDRDLDRWVVESAAHMADQPPDADADRDAHDHAIDELEPGLPYGKAPADDRHNPRTGRATSAVASLIRLSPSTIVTRRRGTPKRRAMTVAAIGSVGETMAPSTNAELQARSSIAEWATTATASRHDHEPH